MAQPGESNSPRTELGRLALGLELPLHEEPSPPGTAPWERYCAGCGERVDVGVRTEAGAVWHWACWKTARARDGE